VSTATVRVPAKVNLALGVGPKRADGFHPLATVYHAIDLHDELRAVASDHGEVRLSVHGDLGERGEAAVVPLGEDNLAVRAARLLQCHGEVQRGVDLALHKVIPVAGGMAGGSADAAAALVACNEVWGLGLGRAELETFAGQLGSDVPFLLHGGTAIGTGRGEAISPVLARGSYHWVCAISPRGLSTPSVFAEFDRLTEGFAVPDPRVPEALLAALRAGDPEQLGEALENDLTAAALSLRPELQDTLDIGLEAGALGALVSGSGPTTVFLAADEQHGMDIAVALASTTMCADVVQSRGPVPGARLV